jgi:hypothetical protein
MTSAECPEFGRWITWGDRGPQAVPNKPGTYIFRLAGGNFGRLTGESDILYIGCAKNQNLQQRAKQHLHSREDEKDIGYLIKRVEEQVGPVEFAWKENADPKAGERELLARYRKDHIELPPLNSNQPGKKFTLAKRRLAQLSPDEIRELKSKLGLA